MLPRSILTILTAALIGLADAPMQPSVDVPFEFTKAMILVEAKVNGRPAILLLDTGAGDTYIDTSMISAHFENDGDANVYTPTGRTQQLVFRAQVNLGAEELHMHVIGIDLSQMRKGCGCKAVGILGMSALQTFSDFEVNLSNKRLILRK
jgi:predicted aspartyl protease